MKRIINRLLPIASAFCILLSGCGSVSDTAPTSSTSSSDISNSTSIQNASSSESSNTTISNESTNDESAVENKEENQDTATKGTEFSLSSVPDYSGPPYVVINNNQPYFENSDYSTSSFESYSSLDTEGRCGVAFANVGQDIMPTEERGNIGSIKPTGWHTIKYDCVDGKYLYNRCHLIGYQLTAENANEKNLITGTRYLNVNGMLPFENMVADYVKETNNHVLYRVTPEFNGSDLVARGVLMEAYSVEDTGDGICFNVFCYNNQPGVSIDYSTGDSQLDGTSETQSTASSLPSTSNQSDTTIASNSVGQTYILNTSSKKFHYPSCSSVDSMKESNKQTYTGAREDLIAQGYDPCGRCKP